MGIRVGGYVPMTFRSPRARNDAGPRMTLTRDGDTLYGVTIDPATRRVTVAVELQRVTAAPEAP